MQIYLFFFIFYLITFPLCGNNNFSVWFLLSTVGINQEHGKGNHVPRKVMEKATPFKAPCGIH